ncbi:MAG: porin [Candidatus Sericytochromatia bacterium]
MNRLYIVFFTVCISILLTKNALSFPKIQIDEEKDIEFIQMIQVFNTTSLNSIRNDTLIRRGRLGVQGHIKKYINYRVWFAYDNIGKDGNTKLIGLAQNTDNSNFSLFDAYFTWELFPQIANISFGYFRPQIGRENITSAFEVNSLEKAITNFYIRPHLVGRANGRETGLNFGGLYLGEFWSLNYNFGFFDLNHEKITGGTNDSKNGSKLWSPLLSSRVSFTLGEPEMKNYKLGYNINYFGKRKGITFGLNYANQGNTDLFKNNSTLGFDLLANYNNFNFDAEYDVLNRNKNDSTSYSDYIFHLRAGYNFNITENWILEPVIMYSQALIDQKSTLGLPSENQIDIGLNWYIDKNNMKLGTHYIKRQESNKQSNDMLNFSCQFIY